MYISKVADCNVNETLLKAINYPLHACIEKKNPIKYFMENGPEEKALPVRFNYF